MNWLSLGRYLVGRRTGIEEIARCPDAVWLGLAFVLLAGIARDYDGEDLVARPYWLIVPFVASLATSLLLYGLAVLIARPKPPEKVVSYRAVLSLYWLTALMAWIYALPVERWLDAAGAMSANLWLLKIVATWRVVLMVRVIAVLFRVSHFFAATIVLFFADSVVVVVSHLTPTPIWNVMGGVRLTESEHVLQNAMCATRVFRYPGMGAKQTELERMLRAVEAIQAAGVAVNACFILGADGETRASVDRLIAFLLDSPFAEIQLTLQTPFPGTGLHQRLLADGRMLPNRDWSFHTLFDVTYQPDVLTVAELESAFRDAVRIVFSTEACRRRDSIRDEIWAHRFAISG